MWGCVVGRLRGSRITGACATFNSSVLTSCGASLVDGQRDKDDRYLIRQEERRVNGQPKEVVYEYGTSEHSQKAEGIRWKRGP